LFIGIQLTSIIINDDNVDVFKIKQACDVVGFLKLGARFLKKGDFLINLLFLIL